MEKRICRICEIEKNINEFDIDKRRRDNISSKCKECRRKYYNQYNNLNREKTNEKHKKRYWENREKELIRSKEKHQRNKEKEIEYRKKNREKKAKRERERYQNDFLYRLKVNLRNRLKLFLKSKKINKINKTIEIVGETPETIKKYIENQFKDGMSWENYGYNGWHIDHIIPLSSAKTEEEAYKLCHYTNLQPLWANENYKKGKKII
jgi:hypothetical protein